MSTTNPSTKFGIEDNIDSLFTKRALVASIFLHALFMTLKLNFEPIKVEPRNDAIKVTMSVPEEILKKNKALRIESKLKEKPEVLKEVPKEKVVPGTQKVIPKADTLGDPKAKEVKKVQKGDPVSKDKSKYIPGTDFQKLKSTNIGTGSGGDKIKTNTPAGGSGDTYKGMDFSVKSMTNNAPLGKRFKVKNAADDMGAGAGSTGGIGNGLGKGFGDGTITGTRTGTLEKAKILTNVGSLTGETVGTIGSSRGAEGLGKKGTILLSGMPQETVVLGSMDPKLIRDILMQHLAQFRYCYQKELEKTGR
ncbi:MAG: hypothetical protein H0V66_13985, partial [Bdellovibrionales bacterium]|nr:hypothetical protein [Bdellovibrionales bacterium]